MVYQARSELPARGQVLISGTSVEPGSAVSLNVSYGRTFPANPFVIVSMAGAPGGSAYAVPRVSSVSPTGFTLYVYNTGDIAWTWTNLAVNWLAVP